MANQRNRIVLSTGTKYGRVNEEKLQREYQSSLISSKYKWLDVVYDDDILDVWTSDDLTSEELTLLETIAQNHDDTTDLLMVADEETTIFDDIKLRTSQTLASYALLTTKHLPKNIPFRVYWEIDYSIPKKNTGGTGEIELVCLIDGVNVWSFQTGLGYQQSLSKGKVSGDHEFTTGDIIEKHTIDIQWRSVDDDTEVIIYRAKLRIKRID